MRRLRPITLLAMLAVGMLTAVLAVPIAADEPQVGAADRELFAATLTDAHVRQAIDALVEELYARKSPDRFWDPPSPPAGRSPQQGGYTALVVLALLQAGESYQHPRLRDAVEYLAGYDMDGVYAIAVRASVWAALPRRFRAHLAADAQRLINGFSSQARGWDYHLNRNTTREDNSIRQFGALGLWEAAKRGVRVPDELWRALERAYLDMQLADGGWNYKGDGPATGSMTAAGLATLFITQDFLHSERAAELDRHDDGRPQHGIRNALDWMRDRFSPTENPGRDEFFYYYLYGVERVALAGGYKHFGGHDWYREGAAELIRRLCDIDAERGVMRIHERPYGDGRRSPFKVDELAFSLMFLSRGRAPIAINKLRDDGTAWNNRPRDVANLVRWISDQTATTLNWQVTDISEPATDWLDAPLLYFASDESPPWLNGITIDVDAYVQSHRAHASLLARGAAPPDHRPSAMPDVPELHRLREYLEHGGLLLVVNEGVGNQFARAMETAGRFMFPLHDWRTLSADHWAYRAHQPIRSNRLRLRGLSNGVRDMILIVSDGDVPATLQRSDFAGSTHDETLANLYFYASEMNRARSRLDALRPLESLLPEIEHRASGRTIRVVEARHNGAWNPESTALPRFAAALAEANDLTLRIEASPLALIGDLPERPDLVIVRGIDAQSFTSAERSAIRRFVEGGGTALFETPGGIGDFTDEAERSMQAVFGEAPRPLVRHAVTTGRGIPFAADCTSAEYRPFSLEIVGSIDSSPRLRGLDVNGRLAVIFSREDLSHALLDQPVWGVHGYAPSTAATLLRNILLYASGSHERESATP